VQPRSRGYFIRMNCLRTTLLVDEYSILWVKRAIIFSLTAIIGVSKG
jgi:hypothetical protein